MSEHYYRYEDKAYAPPLDEWGSVSRGSGRLEVRLIKFDVVRRTPKGAWISWLGCSPRFVLNGARRRYACPTLDEARESFIARKTRQASIYKARMDRAVNAIALVPGGRPLDRLLARASTINW